MPFTAFASAPAHYEITISPPSAAGAPATIRVDDGTGLVAAQARLDDSGDWQDITMLIEFGWAHFDLPHSGRVYISLTDDKGNVHVASQQVNLPPSAIPPPTEPEDTQSPDAGAASPPPSASSSAGIPGATGSVADNITASGEIREFFTITTDNGGIYFLVVDRPSGGVHLLSAVDEYDLAGFIDEDRRPLSGSIGSSPPSNVHPTEPTEPDNVVAEPEPQPAKRGGANPIPIIIAVLAAGGAGYYWKIYRPKQNAGADDYEDEENPSESEDLGPDMEFIAEPDEGEDDYAEEDFYDESEDLEPV
jgi:hypothetical protein